MGASGGSNGRPPAVALAGRPAFDGVYDRLAVDLLSRLGPDRLDDFAEAVARRFKAGASFVCCRAIGEWIEQGLCDRGWTQQALAERVGVDRSAVARWTSGGAISLAHLVLVLLEFRVEFDGLPLPARRELALEGYLAALSHVRQTLDPEGEAGPLDRDRFWCLYHLLSQPHWERAIRARDAEGIRREVQRVLRESAGSLGHPARGVGGVEGVRLLVERWVVAWVVCLQLLPGGWSVG